MAMISAALTQLRLLAARAAYAVGNRLNTGEALGPIWRPRQR